MDIRIIRILFRKIRILRIHNHTVGHIKIVVRIRRRIAFQINIEICAFSTLAAMFSLRETPSICISGFFQFFTLLSSLLFENKEI